VNKVPITFIIESWFLYGSTREGSREQGEHFEIMKVGAIKEFVF